SARELRKRMDRTWGTAEGLRKVVGEVYYRGQKIDPNLKRPWLWLRNYLHERRLEAICCCLPIGMGAAEVASRFPDGLRHRRAVVKATALRRRAELLASADLRARDREEDRAPGTADARRSRWMRNVLRRDATLRKHLAAADSYIEKCFELGDRPWLIPA